MSTTPNVRCWAVVDGRNRPPGDNGDTGLYWSRNEARDWCNFYNTHWKHRGKHVVVKMVPAEGASDGR